LGCRRPTATPGVSGGRAGQTELFARTAEPRAPTWWSRQPYGAQQKPSARLESAQRRRPTRQCTVADLSNQKDPKDNFHPARRPPQVPQACANAAPAPLRGEPLQCSKRANRKDSGVMQQLGPATVPASPRFAPGAADRWRMPGAPAAGFGSDAFPITSSRAQACAQAARPDRSRRREARKNRWCDWRRRLRQSRARAAHLF